jgi:hypothetical protein
MSLTFLPFWLRILVIYLERHVVKLFDYIWENRRRNDPSWRWLFIDDKTRRLDAFWQKHWRLGGLSISQRSIGDNSWCFSSLLSHLCRCEVKSFPPNCLWSWEEGGCLTVDYKYKQGTYIPDWRRLLLWRNFIQKLNSFGISDNMQRWRK